MTLNLFIKISSGKTRNKIEVKNRIMRALDIMHILTILYILFKDNYMNFLHSLKLRYLD